MEHDKKEKLDAFWNIEQLVPPKRKSAAPFREKKVTLVSVTDEKVGESDSADRQLHLPKRPSDSPREEIVCYENLSPFIKRVEIHPWKNSYHYYEFFCKNAQTYYRIHGRECPRVPFFSYVAQYSQMNAEQLNWYFWWRENVRRHIFLDTDLSYIYLYIYEIINLGDLIDTQEALASLVEIWYHYREVYPALNGALGEWICDYSLLNRVSISYPHPFITAEMIRACSFCEPFCGVDVQNERATAEFLIFFCGGYSYRKSKFYAENQVAYDEFLPMCLARVVPFFELGGTSESYKHISKVAFVGALCSYRIRKHIEVDYVSVCNGELRTLVTSILKYAENMLRAYLGIRSRLGCHELPTRIKAEIEAFFEERLSVRTGMIDVAPSYEKLYEKENETFCLEKALMIERESWNITEELVDAFEDTVSKETEFVDSFASPNEVESVDFHEDGEHDEEPKAVFLRALFDYREFFDAIVSRDIEQQHAFCRKKGILLESAVDYVNEKAVDVLEDILIEEAEDGYALIEEYREMFILEV